MRSETLGGWGRMTSVRAADREAGRRSREMDSVMNAPSNRSNYARCAQGASSLASESFSSGECIVATHVKRLTPERAKLNKGIWEILPFRVFIARANLSQ